MKRMSKMAGAILIGMILALNAFSAGADDKKGSKDHPLFNRMPNFHITSYEEKEFDAYDKFRDSDGKRTTVEGRKYHIAYYIDKGATKPSDVQIIRNFTGAITAIGGTVLKEDSTNAYMRLEKGGTLTWIHLRTVNRGEGYTLNIVEEQGMEQVIVADAEALAQDIRMTGKVAVYGIYFDTGKADVKPESEPALQEIAKLLKNDPGLQVYVVGHTDNVGQLEFNMKLSMARAQAVVATLVSQYGVEAARLKPQGVGPLAPVATNEDEQGRAKNRRSELVKQ